MSTHSEIREAFSRDLLTVTTANGYNNNLKKSFDTMKTISALKKEDFDSFHVEDGFTEAKALEGAYQYKWTVIVYFYLMSANSDGGAQLTTKIENLQDDIDKLLKTNLEVEEGIESIELLGWPPILDTDNIKAAYQGIFQITYYM